MPGRRAAARRAAKVETPHQNWKYRNGVTCGAKNRACTVNAKPAVSAQPLARCESTCTRHREDDGPTEQEAGRDFWEAERERIAEIGQQRHRPRDRGERRERLHDHPRQGDAVAAGHAAQHRQHRREAGGAERDPGDDHGQQRQHPPGQRGQRPAPGSVGHEKQAAQAAPDDKIPCRPEHAQQHRRHPVGAAPCRAAPVAAKRDVDILAREPTQRDVRATPKEGDVRRLVGRGKFSGKRTLSMRASPIAMSE